MVDIHFRTDGAWGAGEGVDLPAAEIDANFYNLKTAVETLQTAVGGLTANNIISIAYTGGGLVFTFEDTTTIGPVPIPILAFAFRGDFVAFMTFAVNDVVAAPGVGIFLVLKAHTAGATFDPGLLVGGDPAYQKLLGLDVPATIRLDTDLADVAITPTTGDFLRFNGTQWVNVPRPYIVGTNFNGVMGDAQDLLHHRLAHALSWPANFGTEVDGHASEAGGTVHAAASTVVDILLCPAASDPATAGNYTLIGTVTFASGTVTPTFATVGGTAKAGAKGDVLWVRGPATHDTTFSGFFLTLVGQET